MDKPVQTPATTWVLDLDDAPTESETTIPTGPVERIRDNGPRTRRATILASLLVGGIAGAVILGPLAASAASPSAASPSAALPSAAGSTAPSSGTLSEANGTYADHRGPGCGHGDGSVIAKAIGITEDALRTALQGGQTVVQVAQAKGVTVQTVIDALVADDVSELSAQVTAGRITQAEADAKKAEITQRATDQANGILNGGRH